jgi:hypothetical protein
MEISLRKSLALTFAALCAAAPALAQTAPLPGTGGYSPAAAGQSSAPIPGAATQTAQRRSGYGDLPLNADDAKARILELENLVSASRPQDLQERVDQLCVWLGDMIDAHNKMANAFSKHDDLKSQANAERQAAQRFARLKNQAQLLKADLLIGMRRYPEALVPLVEIVIAEPTTETGKGAYKRLQDLGFSPEIADAQDASSSVVAHPAAANIYRATIVPVRKAVLSPVPKKTANLPGSHR